MTTVITITTDIAKPQAQSRSPAGGSNFSKSPGFKQRIALPSSMSLYAGEAPSKASPTMYSSFETINIGGDKLSQSKEDLIKPESAVEVNKDAIKTPVTHSRRMGIAVIVFAVLLIICQLAVVACISYSLYGYSQFRMYRNGGMYTVFLITLPILLVISVLFVGTGILGVASVWGARRIQTILGIIYACCIAVLMICEEVVIIVLLSYNIAEVTSVLSPLLAISLVGYTIIILLSIIRIYFLTKEDAVHKGESV